MGLLPWKSGARSGTVAAPLQLAARCFELPGESLDASRVFFTPLFPLGRCCEASLPNAQIPSGQSRSPVPRRVAKQLSDAVINGWLGAPSFHDFHPHPSIARTAS